VSVINNLIHLTNIKNKIELIKEELIQECINSKPKKYKDNKTFNYKVNSKHKEYLYNIFIEYALNNLNKFTLKNKDFNIWCYYSDNTFDKSVWHNHINTSTINGVLYLQLPKENGGIDFIKNNIILNIKPRMYDFIMFPNYLNHLPYPSTTEEKRLSINLELRCNEDANYIFKQ